MVSTRQRLTAVCEVSSWAMCSREFLRKYFPEDVSGNKEIKFIDFKQRSLFVNGYASSFIELEKFPTHYSEATVEFPKCTMFENRLRPNIKQVIGYYKIRRFLELVKNYKIYE